MQSARAHVDRLNEAWTTLLDHPDEAVAAELHGELDAVKAQAFVEGWRDVQLLSSKLEDLVFLAHRHHYDVPMELLLTVSMAVEFLGTLVGAPTMEQRSADLPGFVDQLDAVLRETAALPVRTDRSPAPPAIKSSPVTTSSLVRLEPDRLGISTRTRLAAAATNIYLESIRTRGASSLRLRETWATLRRELGDLGRVALAPQLAMHVDSANQLARDRGKVLQISVDLTEMSVSPEIASIFQEAVIRLLHNAVTHGIEPRANRELAQKSPQGSIRLSSRFTDGAVVVTVEDDGAGVDALAAGIVKGGGLSEIRKSVGKEGGSLSVRSVPGRGTAATVSIVDATMSVAVRTFRSSNGHLLLAVDTSWSLHNDGWVRATTLDPVTALGLRAPDESATSHTAVFKRGDMSFEIPVRSPPTLSAASRICPTGVDAVVEVVVVGDTEALLLRLDRLAAPGAQSTVPPNAIANGARMLRTTPPDRERTDRHPRAAHKVLLLDGHATWLVLTRAALLHRGFEVQAVTTLTALGEMLERWTPHIVLADVDKLDISSEELCRQVKHVRPLVPVLLFADMDAAQLALLAERAHADGSLTKALGPDELARALTDRLR